MERFWVEWNWSQSRAWAKARRRCLRSFRLLSVIWATIRLIAWLLIAPLYNFLLVRCFRLLRVCVCFVLIPYGMWWFWIVARSDNEKWRMKSLYSNAFIGYEKFLKTKRWGFSTVARDQVLVARTSIKSSEKPVPECFCRVWRTKQDPSSLRSVGMTEGWFVRDDRGWVRDDRVKGFARNKNGLISYLFVLYKLT